MNYEILDLLNELRMQVEYMCEEGHGDMRSVLTQLDHTTLKIKQIIKDQSELI